MSIRCDFRFLQLKQAPQKKRLGDFGTQVGLNVVRFSVSAREMVIKREPEKKERRKKMMRKVTALAADILVRAPPPLPNVDGVNIVVKVAKEKSGSIQAPSMDALLVRAWYGVATSPWEENHGANVTAAAKSILAKGISLTASNELFGDPCKNLKKVLLVAFDVSVKEVHATAVLDPEEGMKFPIVTASLATAESDDRLSGDSESILDEKEANVEAPAVAVPCTDAAAEEDFEFDGVLRLQSRTFTHNKDESALQDEEGDDSKPYLIHQRGRRRPRSAQMKVPPFVVS